MAHAGNHDQSDGQTRAEIAPQKAFRYRPLEKNAIRLVSFLPRSTPDEICLAMDHFEKYMGYDAPPKSEPTVWKSSRIAPQPAVEYTTLSYCWGDSDNPRPITVNNQRINITSNLWSALSSILQYHNLAQHYWIDALCLNQDDIEERNHQVHQMWRIYADAEQMFSWLGMDDETTAVAYDVLEMVAQGLASRGSKFLDSPPMLEGLLNAHDQLNALLSRDYFDRTWIMSEFLQARKIQLLCGRFRAEGLHFEITASSHVGHSRDLVAAYFLLYIRSTEHKTFGERSGPVDAALGPVLHTICSYSKCSQPQDKIFSLLSHPLVRRADPGTHLKPDYSLSLEELLLVALEWSDCLLQAMLPSYHSLDEVAESLWLNFRVALFPEAENSFGQWICSHFDWDTSTMPQWLIIGNGRKIDMSREVLRRVIRLWGEGKLDHI